MPATRLDRDVGLKVVPPLFTDDPDRLARFEREAKVLASLNHPNIGHIYGLEEAQPSADGQSSGQEAIKALVLEAGGAPPVAVSLAPRTSGGSRRQDPLVPYRLLG